MLHSGLVKAVNTAVDLIVAHFSTSRDPDVKVGDGSECHLQILQARVTNRSSKTRGELALQVD